ncbi:protein-disulfide reductase DsbD domain-containing protein [Methylosinus sp. Ce-a6]|uniref:protein-disulfide reductase DsbD domain-containing protein n=1 Tax=Methylosinus sp. Ce-a6 TaxID=2172005 RepID=UPI001357D559|nr:protein-disulfide reductase DsbD domain-containing protein [Methylosinus sp. Ce-a6]
MHIRNLTTVALALTLLAAPRPAPAQETAFASPAARAAHSAARLLSAGAPDGGVYRVGLEIALDPGTVTYWRNPGDAGAPPVLDFSGSENVAAVETLYPAPKHIVEAGMTVAGYDESVVFPLRVTPKAAGEPVVLKLTLDYAACAKICLPVKAKLSLALPPTGTSPFASRLAAAETLVPRPIDAGEATRFVEAARAGPGAWRLRYLGPGSASDLFVEAPEPYVIDSAADGKGGFELKLGEGKQEGAIAARATIRTEKGGIELPLTLD